MKRYLVQTSQKNTYKGMRTINLAKLEISVLIYSMKDIWHDFENKPHTSIWVLKSNIIEWRCCNES